MLKGLLIAAVALLLGILAAAWFAYRYTFHAPSARKRANDALTVGERYAQKHPEVAQLVRKMVADPYEEVWITARDGTRLMGRYYHVRDGAPLLIQFHGYRSHVYCDFCGGHLLAAEMGCNSLAVDQRSHGRSEGRTICFGIRERWDCLDWALYARQRFGSETPVFLVGVSMGAATVLMASDLPLPETVAGIIADCPYSAPTAIIRKVCGDIHLPQALAYSLAWLGARLYGGLRLEESSALASVAKTRIPILLIHGEADHFVPCAMSREIQARNPTLVQLETFPGAGHGRSFLMDPPRYRALNKAFVSRCQKRSG